MDETIKQIRERHQEEIDTFISNCPHAEISDWIPYMWAPGHFAHNVKICNRCGKTIEEDLSKVTLPWRIEISTMSKNHCQDIREVKKCQGDSNDYGRQNDRRNY